MSYLKERKESPKSDCLYKIIIKVEEAVVWIDRDVAIVTLCLPLPKPGMKILIDIYKMSDLDHNLILEKQTTTH